MIAVDPEKVYFVIVKSRAFDAGVEPESDLEEPTPSHRVVEEELIEEREEHDEDPTYDEVSEFIGSLNEEEQINLVALTWLGRGDFTVEEWQEALQEARAARSDHTASYLLGIPLLSDYLEEGLSQHGYSLEDMESARP